jgi:hypothetical protein
MILTIKDIYTPDATATILSLLDAGCSVSMQSGFGLSDIEVNIPNENSIVLTLQDALKAGGYHLVADTEDRIGWYYNGDYVEWNGPDSDLTPI